MADVTLSTVVKDQYVSLALDALNAYVGKKITITVNNDDSFEEFTFSYAPNAGNAKLFAESVVKGLLRTLVRCYALGIDKKRYISSISAVVQPSQNVPDGIVE